MDFNDAFYVGNNKVTESYRHKVGPGIYLHIF